MFSIWVPRHSIFFNNGDKYTVITTAHKKWLLKNSLYETPTNTKTSSLWGVEGELWDSKGRLPDYSYAGYHAGEKIIPLIPVVANVKDFGAKGDGVKDDTEAFKIAIASANNGAILVPKGKYLITEVLFLQKNNLVLRGEGSGTDGTVLIFPYSLTKMLRIDPAWTWGNGGVIWMGYDSWNNIIGEDLAKITNEPKRGDKIIQLSQNTSLKNGDYIIIQMIESEDRSMEKMLHNGDVDIDRCVWQPSKFLWPVKVKNVTGNSITLAQPLRVGVKQKWSPVINKYNAYQEIGIEHLRIEFPEIPAKGHLLEDGYNAIAMRGVLNSWVKDVVVQNADNGPSLQFSKNISVIGFTHIATNRTPNIVDSGYTGSVFGHHGFTFGSNSSDNLLSKFNTTRFAHDITVDGLSNGNVITNVTGTDISLDHHGNIPYENLFSNINIGIGNRTYNSSGLPCSTPRSGARETFWNLKFNDSSRKASMPVIFGLFPQSNIIPGDSNLSLINRDVFMENINQLEPQDLYQSQLTARAKRDGITLPQKGDINEDGKIDVADFNIYVKYIFKINTQYNQRIIDINDDGKIDLKDFINFPVN